MQDIIKKKPKYSSVNYQVLMEPELKMRLMELKMFHEIDVPEHIRQLIRDWVKEIEERIK